MAASAAINHLPSKLTTAPGMIQRECREESFYSSSSDYCLDDFFSPFTHSGQRCYRQIPNRDSYFSCPASEHVCFDEEGNCDESPDRSSIAESRESDGTCNFNEYCVLEHTAVDFFPAILSELPTPTLGRQLPDGSVRFPDGSIIHPGGRVTLGPGPKF